MDDKIVLEAGTFKNWWWPREDMRKKRDVYQVLDGVIPKPKIMQVLAAMGPTYPPLIVWDSEVRADIESARRWARKVGL